MRSGKRGEGTSWLLRASWCGSAHWEPGKYTCALTIRFLKGPTQRLCQLRAPLALNKKDRGMKHTESEMETMTTNIMKRTGPNCLLIYKEKKYTHRDEENEMKQKEKAVVYCKVLTKKIKIKITFVLLGRDGMRHTYSRACAVPVG